MAVHDDDQPMSLANSRATFTIPLPALGARLLLLAPLFLALVGGWFSARWYFGQTISEVATTGDAPNLDLARVAVRWAPDDPFVHWRLGVLEQENFNASNLEGAVREFESAVRMAPTDFRYWDELGRALEAAGNPAAAEAALRHSVDLAPNYYFPRWHLGNVLLREGRLQEAFPHLFRAADANPQLWPQVLNLAWQAYDGDVDLIASEACKDPAVRITFAIYLVGVQKYDDAVRLWKTLPAQQRAELGGNGRDLRKDLFDAKQFRSALEITKDLESGSPAGINPDEVSNGGFEQPIIIPTIKAFGWSIGNGVQAQISIGDLGHSGHHSMRVIFNAANKIDHINAWQTIAVQPNTHYHLECYARTERLSSASTPVIVVADTADAQPLATSVPLPPGTNDWQRVSVDFTTKNSDGITISVSRLACSVGDVCPIFGTVWYDDFNLQSRQVGIPGRPRGSSAAGNR